MSVEYGQVDDTIYFHFAANDTSGSGADGATPTCDVRLCGAAVDAAPVYSPTPYLLTHATYKPGAHEVAIVASVANGFAAGNTYAAFCSLAVDSQNPNGFVGKFKLDREQVDVVEVAGAAISGVADFKATGFSTHGDPDPNGYIANLNVGGNVASSAEALAIQNNTRVRVIIPPMFERPDSGSTAFKLHLYCYDEAGNMEAPDETPTLAAENQAGTDRSANLGAVTLEATGHYSATYTVASDHAIEQLLFQWTVTEGAVARLHGGQGFVVDTTAVDFTAADRTKLEAVFNDWADAGRLDALLDGVKAVTDVLPDDGALSSLAQATALATHDGKLVTVDTVVDAALAILKADKVIDISATPAWELVYYVQGAAQEAGNEIMRKALKQPDGTNVTSADHLVGQENHTT